jgi:hypothetical protein
MHPAYAIGQMDAAIRVGLQKTANKALLKELGGAALAGGGLGGVGGAIAGGEGNRLEGALMGAGLGAAGGALGKGIGRSMTAPATAKVEGAMARDLGRAMKSRSGGALHGAAAKGRKAKYMRGPSRSRFDKKLQDVQAAGAKTQRGTTMLGGVAGTAGGMGMASGLETPPTPPPTRAMNPYGY